MRRKFNSIVKLHVKKDDTVKVLSGDYKGVVGKVLRVFPEKQKAIVEGVNMIKKHVKPNEQYREGAILEFESPILVCKLQVIDSNGNASRIGRRKTDKGWVRYSKKSGQNI